MGKSLKGKELGKGITQRKDGTYMGRFVDRYGKTRYVYDKTYNHLCKKLRDAQYEDDKALNIGTPDMTLDEWFDIWIKEFKTNCRDTTIAEYKTKYDNYVHKELGWRKINTINTLMLQQFLNKLEAPTIKRDIRLILLGVFNEAVESDLISKNPVGKTKIAKHKSHDRRVMSREEQKIFCEFSKNYTQYNMYRLALETGMRAGELCGLMWDDINFEDKIIHVKHNMVKLKKSDDRIECVLHPPKSASGERLIPLTSTAITYLEAQKKITGSIGVIEGYGDMVFRTRANEPLEPQNPSACLIYISEQIRKAYPDFKNVTMHTLRHTFATRAIENGMRPKSLQKIMGHSTLAMTMDLYCHVTDESLFDEMKKMESPESV